jgi:hypothetical protein
MAVSGFVLPNLTDKPEANAETAFSGATNSGKAKSCILVYLLGGPPHLDMWDMKPDAPAEIRGEFQPISSSLPGVQVCELLPKLA